MSRDLSKEFNAAGACFVAGLDELVLFKSINIVALLLEI
jgi:hypothetical protein